MYMPTVTNTSKLQMQQVGIYMQQAPAYKQANTQAASQQTNMTWM